MSPGLDDVSDPSRPFRALASRLVDQVHQVLGRHRNDDSRTGRIGGLDEELGEAHPTRGGLRIGKRLPERRTDEPDEPDDAELASEPEPLIVAAWRSGRPRTKAGTSLGRAGSHAGRQ